MPRDLSASWHEDLRLLAPAADTTQTARVVTDLLDRWSQPHRRYHDTQHLIEMLDALDLLAGRLSRHENAVLHAAAWLHDAVYDPHAPFGQSERASARLARIELAALGVRDQDVARVESLILMTIDHDDAAGTPGSAALHDADLWILAAPAERFDEYCAQVRSEYAHVPDGAYRSARAAILQQLVDGSGIYDTHLARVAWTDPARTNLAREFGRLAADPDDHLR